MTIAFNRRPGLFLSTLFAVAMALMSFAGSPAFAAEEVPPEQAAFFESRIRPILANNCYECHGEERQRGSLRLDGLGDLLHGGEIGPAVVPGDVEGSPLIEAVRYDNPDLQMPPEEKLSDRDIAALEEWVKMGAPWPGGDPDMLRSSREAFTITDEDRDYWAFQPITRPELPQTQADVQHPIDAFIQARLEEEQLQPNDRADRRTLIRRAYFDLIGLPPSPEAVEAFVNDDSPNAWENLIDDLLAQPEYGQRWGRHWLDVVRFAQTDGYERDNPKRLAWKYRDYVIESFNEDKPYDQFVREQLAGDELENPTDETIIATGFYRLGVWDDEPDDQAVARYDYLDDIMNTTGAAFLGLTVSCARCHDHMFDPISQKDYYELVAVFHNIKQPNTVQKGDPLFGTESRIYEPLGDREKIAAHREQYEQKLADLRAQREAVADDAENADEQRKQLDEKIKQLREERPPFEFALAAREHGPEPEPTHVLIRGMPSSPGDEVTPRLPEVLGNEPLEPIRPDHGQSSGRRRAFAEWVASDDNPLTARVMANRIWLHHFGRGIVESTTDFGNAGIDPTHPDLLDYLAAEFVDADWSIKHMHRTIMLSEAYQRSSRADNSTNAARDPGNHLLWRQSMQRLEAEALRDSILAVSGELNLEHGGKGFFPRLTGEVLAGASQPGAGWEISDEDQIRRRSIYTYIRRTTAVPMMEMFDYTTTTSPMGERPVTTVAPQALLLLNDRFMQRQARAFADRLEREAGDEIDDQVRRLYQLALNREPSDHEVQVARDFVTQQEEAYHAMTDRLSFEANVPTQLQSRYLNQLSSEHFIFAPPTWQPHRGAWGNDYSGSRPVVEEQGPFALWEAGPALADTTVQATLSPQLSLVFGGLIIRGTAHDGVLHGYDVTLHPRDGAVILRRHDDEGVRTLGETSLATSPGERHHLRVVAEGDRFRVYVDNAETAAIDVVDEDPIPHGYIGARAWGAGLNIDRLEHTGEPVDPVELMPETGVAHQFDGWQYFGGAWSVQPGNVHRVAAEPGVKAIWNEAAIDDGELTADVRLESEEGNINLLARVSDPKPEVDAMNAYAVGIDRGGVTLGRHRNNWNQLARHETPMELDRWYAVRVVLEGRRIRVFLDGAEEPVIDHVDDADPLTSGNVGIRSFKADGAVRDLVVHTDDTTLAADFALPEQPPAATDPAVSPRSPRERALASLCLVVLNLNEMVYID